MNRSTLLASALFVLTSTVPSIVSAAPVASGLAERAESEDLVPVIVRLDLDFDIETPDMDRGRVRAQRLAIATAQDRAIERLNPVAFETVKAFRLSPAFAVHVTADELKILAAMPGVLRIDEDTLSAPSLDESVPQIGADEVHDLGYRGDGKAVVIIDTGVDRYHPDFGGRVVDGACFSTNSGSSVESNCPSGDDVEYGVNAGTFCDLSLSSSCEHGTHVASIAAGMRGVAPRAEIITIQAFSTFWSDSSCDGNAPCMRSYSSDTELALEYVYDLRNDYDIASVNMSLGGGEYANPCDGDVRADAIEALKGAGIATVIASGNSGYTSALSAPACVSAGISVGRVNGSDQVASSSSSAYFLDLLAPGSSIYAAVPGGYENKSGTSMSAPHVAGAFAILAEGNPGASVDEILDILKETGTEIVDPKSGLITPRINVDDALDEATGMFWGDGRVVRMDMTSAEYQDALNHLSYNGYKLIDIDGYTVNGETRYAAVWKEGGGAWVSHHGMSSSTYQSKFDTYVAKGYRLTHVSGFSVEGEDRYNAIWEKTSGGSWVARHRMSEAQLASYHTSYIDSGYDLIKLSGYDKGGVRTYAALWEKKSNDKRKGYWAQNSSQYQSTFDSMTASGWQLKDVNGYTVNGATYYASVWKKGSKNLVARHGMSQSSFEAYLEQYAGQGYRVRSISGFGTSSDSFAAVWVK